ncbi:MAG: uroporphyrinogen-III synthase [Verrucomicrobiota bacterium]|nr:uroporphyrinogen-III synthase [Verrucomicrobiota bacterium]
MKKAVTREKSPGPLAGKRIVLTRARSQNVELASRLTDVGAEVIEIPLIEIQPEKSPEHLADVFAEIGAYEWIVFTSTNGVKFFFAHFFRVFEDIRALGMMRIAAVGPATAEAVRHFHLKVDVTPPEAQAESLCESMEKEQSLDNLRVLVITGNLNKDTVVRRLEAVDAIVDVLQVYHTELTDLSQDTDAKDFRTHGADAILFASGSAAQSFASQAAALQLHPGAKKPQACSIGPGTSAVMKKVGIPVDIEASEHNLDGIIAALVENLGAKR